MRQITRIALVLALLLLTAAPVAAAPTLVQGDFSVALDFSSLTVTPVGGNCRLSVQGTLFFTGTLTGQAEGTTSALVFAPCAEVAANPPGTFRDVFRSELSFEGTVNGVPTSADLVYFGNTAVGGEIDALMILSGGPHGVLEVAATVGVGGSYAGFVKLP